MAESCAYETVIVWRAFRGIYGFNPGVEQPICGDETARAVVHCSLCAIDLFRYISRKFLGLITQERKSLILCALCATTSVA